MIDNTNAEPRDIICLPEDLSFDFNIDVFRVIMSFCRDADLLQLSLTSHLVRGEAIMEIVSRPLVLRGSHQARSFSSFILAVDNPDTLFSLFQSLTLEDQAREMSDADRIILEMLGRATQLRELTLYQCDTFLLDPLFVHAIGTQQHLRFLRIYVRNLGSRSGIFDAVRGLGSSLKILEVVYITYKRNALLEHDAFFHSLALIHPQIERLTTPCWNLTAPQWHSFPHVRVLDLTVVLFNIHALLPDLVAAFPRLEQLTLLVLGYGFGVLDSPLTMLMRAISLDHQAEGKGWSRLALLSGPITTLYTLAISCPVSSLCVTAYERRYHAAFVDIVSRTRPGRVELHIMYAPEDPEMGDAPAQGDDPAYRAVSHLLVYFIVNASSVPTPSTSDVLRTLAPFLANSQAQYLHLVIKFVLHGHGGDTNVHPNVGQHSEVDAAMAAIDVAAVVAGLATSGTHLRNIVLDRVVATRAGDRSVWENVKADGQQTLKRLGPAMGRQVIAREEPTRPGYGSSTFF